MKTLWNALDDDGNGLLDLQVVGARGARLSALYLVRWCVLIDLWSPGVVLWAAGPGRKILVPGTALLVLF